MKLSTLLIVVLPLTLLSCSENGSSDKPENLIDEETYIDLIAEFQLIKAQSSVMRSSDRYPDSAKTLIFRQYDITEEQFLLSNEYYQQQVASQINRINHVINELEEEQAELLRSRADSLQTDSMSVDSLKDTSSALDTLSTDL